MKPTLFFFLYIFFQFGLSAQQKDTIEAEGRIITLSEVMVRSGTNVPGFIERVKADTSFYKAFRNLRILNYSSLNDIRMMDKKGKLKASLNSRTRQDAWQGCRITHKIEEKYSGDFYDKKGRYNYYTAKLYDGLFFSFDTLCGQHNRVNDAPLSIQGKSGIDKNKEQLKMLFFNPGSDIPGIPLMGDKVKIFDPEHAALYDFDIDILNRGGVQCYVFSIKTKSGLSSFEKGKIVIDEMVTWFDYKSFEVLARNYSMSYNAGVYQFDVRMEVEMAHAGKYLVPSVIRYNGNWGVAFKKKERGVFTATIFDVEQ
ncbi:MAG: hypothetical protein ACRC2O_15035 [Chitinophagaceae bacterium]